MVVNVMARVIYHNFLKGLYYVQCTIYYYTLCCYIFQKYFDVTILIILGIKEMPTFLEEKTGYPNILTHFFLSYLFSHPFFLSLFTVPD